MIYTSYFGNIKNLPDGYKLICISRICPKGMKIKMYGKLAPSQSLLTDYKSGLLSWEEYTNRYKEETLSLLSPQKVVEELGNNVILLCYEKPEDNCHRHIIRDWLNSAGFEICEYEKKKA